VGSFTGDEMRNSILAMLLLSGCYAELGLHIAARYYAAGATYIALHTEDEDIRSLLPKAGFALAQAFYNAGECMTFLLALRQFIGMHLILLTIPSILRNTANSRKPSPMPRFSGQSPAARHPI
jgi:hypothetical protein